MIERKQRTDGSIDLEIVAFYHERPAFRFTPYELANRRDDWFRGVSEGRITEALERLRADGYIELVRGHYGVPSPPTKRCPTCGQRVREAATNNRASTAPSQTPPESAPIKTNRPSTEVEEGTA